MKKVLRVWQIRSQELRTTDQARNIRCMGAEVFTPADIIYYTPVCNMHIEESAVISDSYLETAFHLHNHPGGTAYEDGTVELLRPKLEGGWNDMHSMSVGDIVEMDNKFYMVDPFGFEEIELPTRFLKMLEEGVFENA